MGVILRLGTAHKSLMQRLVVGDAAKLDFGRAILQYEVC